jgi:subtilisin family serine protease
VADIETIIPAFPSSDPGRDIMKHSPWTRVVVAVAAAGSLVASSAMASGVDAEKPPSPPGLEKRPVKEVSEVPASETGSYIVMLEDGALVTEFEQTELDSSEARAKGRNLAKGHDQILADVGVSASNKLHSYSVALNGFAAKMSQLQAQKIAAREGVALVVPDELQQPTTDASGDFLGLAGPGGVWDVGYTGEDVVIGVIDSGIWPEHPSLADDGTYPAISHDVPCDFGGDESHLAPGLSDPAFECNGKLLGARYAMETYVTLTGLTPVEYASARDENGHGTHTATTAAGNANVAASLFGIDRGLVSGVAPRARVIAYKALGELGGYSSDLAGAIDLAVADGVDVINYSIGSSSFAIGADDVAFFFAALAGVHVATSNGNAGPGAATVGSPATVPWLTSVGASTHDRTFEADVVLTSGKKSKKGEPTLTVSGASITGGTDSSQIVDAADLGNELCLSDQKFKGKIKGKIVLCKRGVTARVDKSFAVHLNGGAGMILYNVDDTSDLVTDSHWVPSVHVRLSDGLAIKNYIDTVKKPLAELTGGVKTPTQGSVMAAFSSRGENLLSADIIKPDVTAPGVNILAGNTPTPTVGAPGDLFQSISGTSMSSPHVAGLMALLDQAQPEWTPAMVKSALMTTARQDVFKEGGVTPADPFDMGAGHVDPPDMFDPGVVYDVGNFAGQGGLYEYAGVACGVGLDLLGACELLGQLGFNEVSDFNQASIASGSLAGRQTFVRTVTNVTGGDLTLTPQFGGLEGLSARVEPDTVTVAPGATASFEVTIERSTAPLNEWTFGSLALIGGGYSVHSPIAVRPVTLGVPYEVSAELAAGAVSFGVDFGYDGDYLAQGHGLLPATITNGTVEQDPDQTFDPSDAGAGATAHTVDVPEGSAALRIHVPRVDPDDNIDLDLFVFDPAGNLYDLSGNGGTNETVDAILPMAGEWTYFVHGWGVGGPGATTDYIARTWVVSADPGGNMTVEAPLTATLGDTGTVDVSWPSGLPADHYLGAVSHTADGALDDLTLISVD